ncbi:hypothetical protein AAG906_019697 [Vitis piasezkii]
MKETESIVEMITRFTEIVNGLEALGRVINESEKVMKILRSLPSKWHTKVTAIQEAKDLTKLPMEELLGSLMTYEISLTKQLQESEDKKKKSIALKATTKDEEDVEEEKPSEEDDDLALITRKLNKYMRGERFRGKKESSSHGNKEKWEEKGDLICFKCKKSGHIKYDCPLYKIEAKRRMKKVMMATWSESEESSEEEKEKEVANMCFMAIDDLDEGSKEDKWFLDSGCSRHMIGDESKFAFLTKRKGGYVTFGDNAKGRIIGQGNIGNGTSSLIESVLLVDGLKHNLLSISQLCDKGFKVIFEASHCIIKDIQNDKTIFMGHRCENSSMGKLQIEDKRQQEESGEDPKKEESPLALPPPQQVQGESSQNLPKDWNMMGELNFFLGLQIKQLKEGTFINQAKYIKDLLKRFNMEEAKGDNFELIGFSDRFCGCRVERKSTSGTCHFLGHSLAPAFSTVLHRSLKTLHLPAFRDQFGLFFGPISGFRVIFDTILRLGFHPWTDLGQGFRVCGCIFISAFILCLDSFFTSFASLMAPRRETGTSKAQGKRLLSHLSPSRRRLAERRGMTPHSSVRMRTINATSKNLLRGKSSQGEVSISPTFSTLALRVTISEPVFPTLVRAFYSRATYGLGGPVLSTMRGVEIRLSPESICRILDIPSVGLRIYEAKAWPTVPGFEPREAVQRLCGLADP